VERHEDHPRFYPLGELNPCYESPPTAAHPDVFAVGDPHPRAVFRIEVRYELGHFTVEVLAAPRHRSGEVMGIARSGGQPERILFVRGFRGRLVLDCMKEPTSSREFAYVQDGRSRMIRSWARPAKLLSFEPGVAYSSEGRVQAGHFVENLFRILVVHGVLKPSGKLLDDLPVRLSRNRLYRLAHPLHAPLGIAEGAVYLGKGRRRQDDMSKRSRWGGENVYGHEELHGFQRVLHMVRIRIAHHGILSQNHHCLDLAVAASLQHFHDGQSHIGRHLPFPGRLEFLPVLRDGDRLVAGIDVGKGTHVARALYIVLAPQGVHPGRRTPDLTAQHRQIGKTLHVVHRRGVLSDAQAVNDGACLRFGIAFRYFDNRRGGHAGNLGDPFGRILLDHLDQGIGVFSALFDECLVVPAIPVNDVHHAVDEGHIRAEFVLDVDIRQSGHMRFPRIGNDEPVSFGLGL